MYNYAKARAKGGAHGVQGEKLRFTGSEQESGSRSGAAKNCGGSAANHARPGKQDPRIEKKPPADRNWSEIE